MRAIRLLSRPLNGDLADRMPLHFGKIGAAIALLTVAAFVAWLIFTTFFATEEAEQKIEQTGAIALSGVAAS
jgi:hypothetical protein